MITLGEIMRTATRVLIAGFVSVLAIGILPASADAAQAKTNIIYCCR